jgi:branched-chain amino acid transport system ATP-binding protein
MLSVAGLSSGYGDLTVVHDIDLQVGPGEFVALVGSNAAGKSTFLRALFGLLPQKSGRVEFDQAEISGLPAYAIARHGISLVMEHTVLRGMSVFDNLLLGAYPAAARAHIDEGLARVFGLFPVLAERRRQLATSLSGGEQQMLCIGRAMMGRPKMLVLDEPSVGLSPSMVTFILKALIQLNRDGLPILLVEQNVTQTLRAVSRAYVLERGRIVLEGAAADLLENPSVKVAYLGL